MNWIIQSILCGAIFFISCLAVSYVRGKRELEKENGHLKCRITDLEARICPNDKHNWMYVYTEEKGGITDCPRTSRYKCLRCGKIKNVPRWGP